MAEKRPGQPTDGGMNIVVTLGPDEAERLKELARRELRMPSQQATYELRRLLNERTLEPA